MLLPRPREADVLRAVMDYLGTQGFAVWRRNVGAIAVEDRYIRFNEPGMADVWGVERATGRHLEVEVKAPGEKPTYQQRLWLVAMEAANVIAFWTDSLEDCKAKLAARRTR